MSSHLTEGISMAVSRSVDGLVSARARRTCEEGVNHCEVGVNPGDGLVSARARRTCAEGVNHCEEGARGEGARVGERWVGAG